MLPATRMSPASDARSLPTSVATSPRTMVEFSHSAVSSVEETTYFGMPFILAAKPTSSVIDGHALREALVGDAAEQHRLGAHELVELVAVTVVARART